MRRRDEQANLVLALRHFEVNESESFTAYDIAAVLNLDVRNARPYMKILHERRNVFIEGYLKKPNGPAVPRYRLNPLGDHEDAEYPKALTVAESMRRQRAFRKAAQPKIIKFLPKAKRKPKQKPQQNPLSLLSQITFLIGA